MSDRLLTALALNRALLDRQLLLERAVLDIPVALERVAGLQMQYAPSGYIGLWSRLAGFRREHLTDALARRDAIQATLMRATIHLVSRADFWPLAAGVRRARQEWWMRVQSPANRDVDLRAAADHLRRFLADGPRPQRELAAELEKAGFPRSTWNGVGMFVDLVRVPPSGTWERRRADLYGLAESWIGPDGSTEEEGLEHLVRRYVGGFGPAAVADIASWAQVPPTTLKPVVGRLQLATFRDERGRTLYDLPELSLPDPQTPAPVRLLPTWDANLLVHARRAAIMPERYRPIVFSTKLPHSMPTFLVDGVVRGRWRYEDGRVKIEPFDRIPAAARRALEEEGERMAAFHAG